MQKQSFSVVDKLHIEALGEENQDRKLWVVNLKLNKKAFNVHWPGLMLIQISNEIQRWHGKEFVTCEVVESRGDVMHYKLFVQNNGVKDLSAFMTALFEYADNYIRMIEFMQKAQPVAVEFIEGVKAKLNAIAQIEKIGEDLLVEAHEVATIPFYPSSTRHLSQLHGAELVDKEGFMDDKTATAVMELLDIDADSLRPVFRS